MTNQILKIILGIEQYVESLEILRNLPKNKLTSKGWQNVTVISIFTLIAFLDILGWLFNNIFSLSELSWRRISIDLKPFIRNRLERIYRSRRQFSVWCWIQSIIYHHTTIITRRNIANILENLLICVTSRPRSFPYHINWSFVCWIALMLIINNWTMSWVLDIFDILSHSSNRDNRCLLIVDRRLSDDTDDSFFRVTSLDYDMLLIELLLVRFLPAWCRVFRSLGFLVISVIHILVLYRFLILLCYSIWTLLH